MSTKFFFKKFSIENFRVFKRIEFGGIKRLNIISGINGSGKSALIETMFLSLDLANPTCLLRPYQWRGIPLGGDDLKQLFPLPGSSTRIEAITAQGTLEIKLSYGFSKDETILSSSNSYANPNALSKLSASKVEGVNIIATENGSQSKKLFIYQANGAINTTGFGSPNGLVASGTYLSQFAPSAPQEGADRVSQLIKKGKKHTIISHLKMLNSDVDDIAVFQDGSVAQVYVYRGGQPLTPLALMGSGLRALTEIVTCAMASNGGVVFIDELDSALHFSVIPKLWQVLAEIANIENVQIFAVTHSRETISSAAIGVRDAGRSSDFQYMRIDDLGDHHRCVQYSIDELQDAIDLHVEVR